jgi:hypothetical protein
MFTLIPGGLDEREGDLERSKPHYADEITECIPVDIEGKEVVYFSTRKKGPRLTAIDRVTGPGDKVYCYMNRGAILDILFLNEKWQGFAGREITGDDIIRASSAAYGLVPFDVVKDVLMTDDDHLRELISNNDLLFEQDETGEFGVAFDSLWGRYEEEMRKEARK